LPKSLTENLADAEVEVLSWSAETQELALRMKKEIGPEHGVLRFCGISHIELVPQFTLAGLSVGSTEAGEPVFHLHEAWGKTYRVVAESLIYTVVA
jgi:hypothetical protein